MLSAKYDATMPTATNYYTMTGIHGTWYIKEKVWYNILTHDGKIAVKYFRFIPYLKGIIYNATL